MADPTPEPDAAASPGAPPPIADPLREGEQFEVVAHACAIAVADAVAHLRNTQIVAEAAVGVALERMLAEKDPAYAAAIEAAQGSVYSAVAALSLVGEATAVLLSKFPEPGRAD
jgi:hypothetical protein